MMSRDVVRADYTETTVVVEDGCVTALRHVERM
jgi:hypothetical protein